LGTSLINTLSLKMDPNLLDRNSDISMDLAAWLPLSPSIHTIAALLEAKKQLLQSDFCSQRVYTNRDRLKSPFSYIIMSRRQHSVVIALIAILMTISTQHSVEGLRAVRHHDRAMRVSSTIDRTSPSSVLQRITKAASYIVRNPLRAQYAAAMGARFSWFLNQGIALSLSGIDQASQADEEKMRFNRQGLSVSSVMGALVDAIITDDETAINVSTPLQSSDMTDEQRALFGKNFLSIIRLLRKDLKHIEEGVYKFPYDLRPSYAPQWGGPQVLAQLQAYVTDRRDVLAR
jgi:hypothetical protein